MKGRIFNKSLLRVTYCLSFVIILVLVGIMVSPYKAEAINSKPAEIVEMKVVLKEVKASGERIYIQIPVDEPEPEVIYEENFITIEEKQAEEEVEDTTMKMKAASALELVKTSMPKRVAMEMVIDFEIAIPKFSKPSENEEIHPTTTLNVTNNKVILQYAGSIDYDAILQGPVIYDFGPEGELALEWVVWHESRGEPFDGQVAVAATAINRLYSSCTWFSDKSSIIGILSEPYQFAYQYVSPESLEAHPSVHKAVQAAIRGADPTVCEVFPDGAMWYYNPEGTEQTFPEANYELVIGHHHFHNYGYKWKQ